MDIDVASIAQLLSEDTSISADEFASLLQTSIDATRAGRPTDERTNLRLTEIMCQLPGGEAFVKMATVDPGSLTTIVNRMHGAVDDGFGVSGFVRAVEKCTDEELLRARRWHQAIRFNKMASVRRSLKLDSLTEEQRQAAEFLFANDAMLRKCIRSGPDESVLVFAAILNDEVPAKAPNWKRTMPNVNTLMKQLRDGPPRAEP